MKTLLVLLASFFLAGMAHGQGMTPYYTYITSLTTGSTGTTWSGEYEITGYTYCSGSGCPLGVTHSGSITIEINDSTLGGGGVFTGINPVTPDEDLTAIRFVNLATPVFINFKAYGSVQCTRVGTISN